MEFEICEFKLVFGSLYRIRLEDGTVSLRLKP